MATQYIYPDGFTQNGSWQDGGGATTNLHTDVDEAHDSLNTGDYVGNYATTPAIGDWIEFTLQNPATVPSDNGHEVHISVDDFTGARAHDVDVELRQGTTVIASWTISTTTNSDRALSVTSGQAANITDYTNLRVRVIHASNAGTGPDATYVFAVHVALPSKESLSGTLTGSVDATATGSIVRPLAGTLASRLDAEATGQRLYWSFKIRLDADATGEVFSGATSHALSGSLASRLDADAVGTRFIPLSASLASRLDADAEGDVTSILFLSGTLAARLDAEATGVLLAAISGSLAIRLDAEAVGSRLAALSGSLAMRVDATAEGEIPTVKPRLIEDLDASSVTSRRLLASYARW